MNDTKTPRTDAEATQSCDSGLRSAFVVHVDFARELEREIERLTAERDEARTRHMMLLADLGPDGLERYKNLMRNRYRPDLSLVSISWSVLERQI